MADVRPTHYAADKHQLLITEFSLLILFQNFAIDLFCPTVHATYMVSNAVFGKVVATCSTPVTVFSLLANPLANWNIIIQYKFYIITAAVHTDSIN